MNMNKICEMTGVREYGDGLPVELHIDDITGRLIVIAFNESGECATYVDLNDLIKWARKGPDSHRVIADVNGTDIAGCAART